MSPAAAAARVVEHALSRPPSLGSARLVCLDGPSGSGKSTLVDAIVARHRAQVIAVDELFPGWDGFAEMPRVVAALLRPMAYGGDGHWRRWDWPSGRYAEWHRVRSGGLIVLEGVGSGHRRWADLVTTLAWVEAPRAERLRRGLRRDDGMDEHWRRWLVQEDALFAREHTRRRADLVLDTRT